MQTTRSLRIRFHMQDFIKQRIIKTKNALTSPPRTLPRRKSLLGIVLRP